jgi:hypothetical protein
MAIYSEYKESESIFLEIGPKCIPETDAQGIKTGKMKCLPHIKSPEEVKKMIEEIQSVLAPHGFDINLFGSAEAMKKSFLKKNIKKTSDID